jgi:transcriptional regulator with XRE-family HTH domain
MTLKLSENLREIPINPIRHARMKYGLTQTQLSELTGVPMRTIQNWETGSRKCPEYVTKMILAMLEQKFNHPDYQTILEEMLDMLEHDVRHLKTDEARNYVANVITDIKDSMK